MTTRRLSNIIKGIPTSDGAGVKLVRSLGSSRSLRVDPFLMLDEISADQASDYIGGFPAHPHRGFETVTYMLQGHMLHEDHMGNRGDLQSGDVQWMTAGRGIIHSEMPQQSEGRMHGFQLWLNLPAAEKMKPAAYRDIPAIDIPVVSLPQGGDARVIAGRYEDGDDHVPGPINGDGNELTTAPLFLDVRLSAAAVFRHGVPEQHNAFAYVYAGNLQVGGKALPSQHAGVLSQGDQIELMAGPQGSRFLLLAGKPLKEPMAQYGPFVMNSMEEVEQAIRDYQNGTLTDAA